MGLTIWCSAKCKTASELPRGDGLEPFGKRRREHHLTLRQLADRVPMSASNLSRIELGAQGPPADEIIERISTALDADPAELLQAAGRYATGKSFEETVLARLDAIGEDVREVKAAVTGGKAR